MDCIWVDFDFGLNFYRYTAALSLMDMHELPVMECFFVGKFTP